MQNWRKHIFGLKDVVIFSLFSLLMGLLAGFFLAPIKKGMNIGCNNGNDLVPELSRGGDDDKDFHDDLEMEMNELR